MATSPSSPPHSQTYPAWLEFLTARRRETAYALFAVCVIAAGAGIWTISKHGWENLAPIWLWCFALALIALAAGLWQLLREPIGQMPEADIMRLVVLIVGGLVGFVTTAALGLGLAYLWRSTLTGGWEVWQGEQGWRIWVIALAVAGGLAIMFFSLQLARTQTRTSALFRRLLYGYNAVLGSLLLLAILVVINVLFYLPVKPFSAFNKPYPWATLSIYSLSSKSENILKDLDRTVKVYVMMRAGGELYDPVRALLDNCHSISDHVQAEYLSPERNQEQINDLRERYKFGNQPQGLLVVYGSGEGAQSHFITPSDLAETSQAGRDRPQSFNGEAALLSAIAFMKENKQRPVVYFTQGSDEPKIGDYQTRRGLGSLRRRLQDRGYYQVKGLEFSSDENPKPSGDPDIVVSKQVPKDASAVVVAGPLDPLSAPALEGLRAYMKQGGKMIVLLGMLRRPEEPSEMRHVGMEDFLREFNVRVGDEVVLTDQPPVQRVLTVVNPDEGVRRRNDLAASFSRVVIPLISPRPVQADRPDSPAGRYTVDVLLEVPVRAGPWLQPNLRQISDQFVYLLRQTGELQKRLSPRPVPVAVAVSEDDSAVPPDEIHARVPRGKQRPRLVVVGDSSWVTNILVESSEGFYYDLFASSLAWLRERPASIGIEPKKSDEFTWHADSSVSRMTLLPALLALVGIIGLGTGVWVVRRR